MFNSKFNGLLTVLLIIAIIGIVALIGYFGWSVYNKYYLNASASDAVDAFEQSAGNQNNNETPPKENQNTEQNEIGGTQIGDVSQTNSIYEQSSGSSENSSNTYYGYKILGTISIPKIDIKYPILEKATPKAIKVAVGYLAGAGVNKVGNTVIQGHNLRNGLFFSNLGKLSNGDKIYITSEDGQKITYEVYQVFLASESDSSFYNRETNGLREITLSTCTDDGSQRIIVLAREVKE